MDASEVLNRSAEGPDAVVRYADHADGLVDVFLPASLGRPVEPAPLIVFLHGGFWRQAYDRQHVRPLANALVADGFVVAVPEYRRIGGTGDAVGAGGWPTTPQDVEAALAAIPRLVDEVAPSFIDPMSAYVVAGHSAGGHLALWAGLRAGPSRVRSVVALAPVVDLAEAAAMRLGGGAVLDLLGGGPNDVPERYAEADPLQHLSPGVHVTIVQGTDDLEVPVTANRFLHQRFADEGSISYIELEGVEHYGLIDPLSPVYRDVVLPALRATR